MKSNHKQKMKWIMGILVAICVMGGCVYKVDTSTQTPNRVKQIKIEPMKEISGTQYAQPSIQERARDYLETMTLEQKIGQMFYVTVGSLENPTICDFGGQSIEQDEADMLKTIPVGGVILFRDNIANDDQTQQLIRDMQDNSTIPLFVGVDEEGGLVSRIGNNPNTSVPDVGPMADIGATGDVTQAYTVGKTLGMSLSELGFNMDFAPDADVLTNPNNYEIGSRSYGSEATLVAGMVAAEVQGLQENHVCAVLKHFPGHGGTIGNTHQDLNYRNTSYEELQQTELVPFSAGIAADADAVLVSHLVYTELDPNKVPSTLSKPIITGVLREDLGYEGIVITDSFQMGSIVNHYEAGEACVLAIEAGTDMILMPSNLQESYDSVCQATRDGRLSEKQIDASCLRILQVKIKRGILTEIE